jgi:hypothetical protein
MSFPWQTTTKPSGIRPMVAFWSNSLGHSPSELIIHGSYMYVSTADGIIEQINMADGTVNNSSWFDNGNGHNSLLWQMAISGNYLYVADSQNGRVSKIDLTNNSIFNMGWCTGLSGVFGIAISGNYLYASVGFMYGSPHSGNAVISQINLSDGTIANANWCTSPSNNIFYDLAISGNYMYAGTDTGVAKINMSDGTVVNSSWCNANTIIPFITINGNVMYGTDVNNGGNGNGPGGNTIIIAINMADGSVLDSNYINNGFTNYGMAVSGTDFYTALNNNNAVYKNTLPTLTITNLCFHEDTFILCENGYRCIKDLRKGDLVFTLINGLVPIESIGHSKIFNPANQLRCQNRLYKYSADKISGLIKDLVITGCHSVLVNDLTNQQKEDTIDLLGRIMATDNKYRLMACLDNRSEPYEVEGLHNIWHFALEHEDKRMNYGIYANGLLVETTSIRMMHELSGMELV